MNRTIDALTRPIPLRMTTAPYAGPPEMMAEAPNAHQLGHLKYYDGPPQDTVHPAPPDIQRPSSHTPAAQCADIVTEMQAVELLHKTLLHTCQPLKTLCKQHYMIVTMAQILRLALHSILDCPLTLWWVGPAT